MYLLFSFPPVPASFPPLSLFPLKKALQISVFLFLAEVPWIPLCWGCATWEMRVPGD